MIRKTLPQNFTAAQEVFLDVIRGIFVIYIRKDPKYFPQSVILYTLLLNKKASDVLS